MTGGSDLMLFSEKVISRNNQALLNYIIILAIILRKFSVYAATYRICTLKYPYYYEITPTVHIDLVLDSDICREISSLA